jgi:hypothetical protein
VPRVQHLAEPLTYNVNRATEFLAYAGLYTTAEGARQMKLIINRNRKDVPLLLVSLLQDGLSTGSVM